MRKDYSEAAEAETARFWDEKARRNISRPSRAVGVDDPLRNRCIEKTQQVVVVRGIRAAVSDLQNQRDRVLDFGCGVGRWVQPLGKCFSDYHGVDISHEMLNIARREFPKKQFSQLTNLKIDASDNSIDFALCVAVLHHNAYVNQDALLHELSRVVRPGGQLLLLESNGERVTGSNHIFYPRHEADWVEATGRAGFRHLKTTGMSYRFADRVMTRVLSRKLSANPIIYRASVLVDSHVMPYLARFLPSRFNERLMMRFEKKNQQTLNQES